MSAQETKSETVGFRLSPQQERLLGVDDDRSAVQCAAVLAGPIREADLRSALHDVVARHEILRTTFPKSAGMRDRSQVIHDELAAEWRSQPADGESLAGPESVTALLAREAQRGFDLDRGPLVRAVLLAPEQDRSLLLLTAHAACADAASLLAILDELAAGYAGQGEPAEPVQYADYAEWRHELTTGEDGEAIDGQEFWRQDAGSRPPAPRILFGRAGVRSGRWLSVPIALAPDQLVALERAADDAGVDAPVFLEACWHALIARLTGADELVIAGWCSGRAQPDLELAVGAYAQPVPIRTRLESDTSLAEVLDQVGRLRTEASSRQDLATAADLSRLCAGAAAGFAHLELGGRQDPVLDVTALTPPAGVALLLASRRHAGVLRVELWHDPDAYDGQDAAELAMRFRTLLLGGVSDPAVQLAGLQLTDQAERARLLAQAAGPAPGADAATPVHQLFEHQVRLTPERPAVAGGGDELSYEQLNVAANRLAHVLRKAGVQRNVTVGLCLERTPRLLEAVLAILKAGGAYVPLNYEHPAARIAHQLSESGARMLVTEAPLLARLPGFDGEVLCIDRDAERIAGGSAADPEPVCAPEDLVYVMYTSGSTGLPKGVAVTHGNLANYATCLADRLQPGDSAMRFGVVSAISTDLGNTCIFPPLISGGCVQLISPGASMDTPAILAECGGQALDVLKITPSHLSALLAGDDAAAALPRRWLLLGGEALSWELAERIRGLAGCQILNHYGPTETTIGCCAYDVTEIRDDAATVPIGRPLAGVRAYVVDPELGLLPPGVPGELCIAGEGVARGYIGGDQDQDGPFRADPFWAAAAARMYRTGDRARYLRDGAIEFLGRVDDQVKIRGFRIEPGEIEAVLARHPAVRQAAVVPERDDGGEARLVAYIASSADPSVEELQAFLGQSLPEYMVPSAFATLESMPFTPSGKIDRRALSGLAAVQIRREAEFVAPRDEVEQEIAAIWAKLLGVERVGVFDDFFALGGHSLLATQAIMRIRREHGDIPLRALLAAPTVAALAEVVRAAAAPK